MKLLVTSHLYPSLLSHTAGSFVHNQVRFLSHHCDIQVVVPTPWFPFPFFRRWSAYRSLPQREQLDGIEVHRPRYVTLPRRVLFAHIWRSYLAAMERSVETRPDLVHAHCAYPDGCAAVRYGRINEVPVVVTVHGHDIKELPHANPLWRALIVDALNEAAAVIAVSSDLASRVKEFGVPADRIHTIPNGVDCELFKPDPSYTPGKEGWHLVYIGRFDPAKGIGVLLEAFARLQRRRSDVQLTLVGGNEATGLEDRFERQMNELGLVRQNVRWVREVSWGEIPKFLRTADLFVLPSFSEGLPLSLIEAMACGLPVVSTRCGGPEEAVDDNVGTLISVGAVDELESAILGILNNYRRYDRTAIRHRAVRMYDYRSVAARINELYNTVR